MKDYDPIYSELPKLIEECYDFLTEEEREAFDLSQESIHFFLEQSELQRLNYEYGIMYNILKRGEF
jgi:hypothetical protein